MLVTLKEILRLGETRGCAVGAFNIPNLETLRAVLDAAAGQDQPVVVMFAQVHESITPLDIMGPVMLRLADQAPVPVCVHLDHGSDLAYLKRALDIGFTSIMYDGSALPLAENTANTAVAVSMAARTGAGVEAELGVIGGRETALSAGLETHPAAGYTDPAHAEAFVRDTGIDALACAFGTAHGMYAAAPRLDLGRVAEIARRTRVPVVMHGGSGIGPEDYRRAIRAGVRKINYFTYLTKAGGDAVKAALSANGEPHLYHEMALWAMEAMRKNAAEAIAVFSCR